MEKVKYAIILAGGMGTRLSEQTVDIPKPLVEVGGIPIIEHVINHLASYGIKHVVIAGGYKVDLIKEYFMSDKHKYQGTIHMTPQGVEGHCSSIPEGLESLIIADTGYSTGTAQRIKICSEYIPEGEPFLMTYGDSVSDVNLSKVEDVFYEHNSLMTLTAVNYQERFGILHIDENNEVIKFAEKSMSKEEFINGGFIICDSKVIDYINPEDEDFSKVIMPRIQEDRKLSAHVHGGFWDAMDTQRDWERLNKLFESNPEYFIRENRRGN